MDRLDAVKVRVQRGPPRGGALFTEVQAAQAKAEALRGLHGGIAVALFFSATSNATPSPCEFAGM